MEIQVSLALHTLTVSQLPSTRATWEDSYWPAWSVIIIALSGSPISRVKTAQPSLTASIQSFRSFSFPGEERPSLNRRTVIKEKLARRHEANRRKGNMILQTNFYFFIFFSYQPGKSIQNFRCDFWGSHQLLHNLLRFGLLLGFANLACSSHLSLVSSLIQLCFNDHFSPRNRNLSLHWSVLNVCINFYLYISFTFHFSQGVSRFRATTGKEALFPTISFPCLLVRISFLIFNVPSPIRINSLFLFFP